MTALLAGYIGAAALAFLALRAVPLAGLVVFVVVSAFHFGSGELRVAELRRGTNLSCGTPDSADPVGLLAYAGQHLSCRWSAGRSRSSK